MAEKVFLEVQSGHGYGSKWVRALLASLSILAILASAANWKWKLGSVLVLALFLCLLHTGSIRRNHSGAIRLFVDGTALLQTVCGQEINTVQGRHGWISRWFSVLTLFDTHQGRKYLCVIYAAENHPDDYRRLLKFLRMYPPSTDAQRMIW